MIYSNVFKFHVCELFALHVENGGRLCQKLCQKFEDKLISLGVDDEI